MKKRAIWLKIGIEMLVVITPIGFTLGSSYTVITKFNPNIAVLMPSQDTLANAEKLKNKLIEEKKTIKIKITPFTSPHDLELCITDVLNVVRSFNFQDNEIIINVTGGTTFMSLALFSVAEKFNLDFVITFDERPYQKQLSEPWVLTPLKRYSVSHM